MLALALLLQVATPPVDWDAEFGAETVEVDPVTGERPVDAYTMDNANAGATPVRSEARAEQFGGQEGIRRVADRLVTLAEADARIGPIFAATDNVRLRRTLFEQFCYLLAAGCDYTGRDMVSAHRDMGLQVEDLNALVQLLQAAMREEGVPFGAQNALLSKLVRMKGEVVTR